MSVFVLRAGKSHAERADNQWWFLEHPLPLFLGKAAADSAVARESGAHWQRRCVLKRRFGRRQSAHAHQGRYQGVCNRLSDGLVGVAAAVQEHRRGGAPLRQSGKGCPLKICSIAACSSTVESSTCFSSLIGRSEEHTSELQSLR